jgi:hypothetical protein
VALAVGDLRKSYEGQEVVACVRFGIAPSQIAVHVVLLADAVAGFYAASVLFRRRPLK